MAPSYPSLMALLEDNPGKAPHCPMCGNTMRLTDSTGPRFTFTCPNCDHAEYFSRAQLGNMCGIVPAGDGWTLR